MNRRQFGTRVASIVCTVLATGLLWASPPREPLEASVPRSWRDARRLMLLVRNVSLPKDRPVVFEFYATDGAADDLLLGSYGILAESDNAEGRWEFKLLQINVTRPLHLWLGQRPQARTLRVRIEPVDGSRRPMRDLDWTVEAVEVMAADVAG